MSKMSLSLKINKTLFFFITKVFERLPDPTIKIIMKNIEVIHMIEVKE